jgi:hypothetical protein
VLKRRKRDRLNGPGQPAAGDGAGGRESDDLDAEEESPRRIGQGRRRLVAAEKGHGRGQYRRVEKQGGAAPYENVGDVDMSKLIPLDLKHRNSVPPSPFPPQVAGDAQLNNVAGSVSDAIPAMATPTVTLFPPQGTSDAHLNRVLLTAVKSIGGDRQLNFTTPAAATSTAAAGFSVPAITLPGHSFYPEALVQPRLQHGSFTNAGAATTQPLMRGEASAKITQPALHPIQFIHPQHSASNAPSTNGTSHFASSPALSDPNLPNAGPGDHPGSLAGSQSSPSAGHSAIQDNHFTLSTSLSQSDTQANHHSRVHTAAQLKPLPERASSSPPDGEQARAGGAIRALSLPPDPKAGAAAARILLPLAAEKGKKRREVSSVVL